MKNVILGSQSPQRLNLLQQIIPQHQLAVVPPSDDAELGFDDCRSLRSIEDRLTQIVDSKLGDVGRQIRGRQSCLDDVCVVCADTIVVVNVESDGPLVLGKPPVGN